SFAHSTSSRFAEHAREDLSDVAHVEVERADPLDLFARETRRDVGVREGVSAEVAALVPRLHRAALHPLVGLLARDARAREREQELAAEDEAARRVQILEHAFGVDDERADER